MKIQLSNCDLDYMIPKGTSQTSILNPKPTLYKMKVHGVFFVVIICKYESPVQL